MNRQSGFCTLRSLQAPCRRSQLRTGDLLGASAVPIAGAIVDSPAVRASIGSGQSHARGLGQIKFDFDNPDEYQACYLITQAVNEICPALIWQLRNSAANYRPPTSDYTRVRRSQ
jgi:hypothetical protein